MHEECLSIIYIYFEFFVVFQHPLRILLRHNPALLQQPLDPIRILAVDDSLHVRLVDLYYHLVTLDILVEDGVLH